jgi:hypothetical protein
MPSIINASSTGAGGIVQTADASGVLQLQSNGTVALSISGAATTFGGNMLLEASGNPTMTVKTTGAGNNPLYRLQADTNYWDMLGVFSDSNDTLRFRYNGTDRMVMNNSGVLALSGGDSDANGVGITFPATQSASSNANTLDDYEEGTFTPTITSQFGTVTAYTSAGTYTKIGRVVTCQMNINLTNVGSASGFLNFSGLPFTTSGVRRPNVSVSREDASTGVYYGVYVDSSTTGGSISTLTFGGISWTNGYVYIALITYPASS